MAITFAFQFNWSGDGVTWIDESTNVWGCDIHAGMHDRVSGAASSANPGSVRGATGGSAGFAGLLNRTSSGATPGLGPSGVVVGSPTDSFDG